MQCARFLSLVCLCVASSWAVAVRAQEASAAPATESTAPATDSPAPPATGGTAASAAAAAEAPAQATDTATPATDASTPPAGPLPGHSYHGEAFNEGPRQKALLLDGMGRTNFPVTTASPEAQQFINQGVAQLHGFWYFEAERSFRQAATLDPECAMAYWGMAQANTSNEKRAKSFIAEAMKRREKVTPREQKYLDALNDYLAAGDDKKRERAEKYASALEKILYDHPEDIEAKAFLALQLWNGRTAGVKLQSPLAVDALLKQIFAVEPLHPSHHYCIHLWDYEKPEFALASSAACGPSLPGIAHMWHMPGHIYSRLKRYPDACWQQEASARVDHAHMMRFQILPDQIHNFAHNNEWLIRNLIYVGRINDATALAKNMIELPQHPKYNLVSRAGCSASFGRARLYDVLTTFEMWDALIGLSATPYLAPTDVEREQVRRSRHLGTAYFALGQTDEGQQQSDSLKAILATKTAERDKAVSEATEKARAEGKEQKDIDAAGEQAKKPTADLIKDLEHAIAELDGHAAAARGEYAAALDLLKKADNIDAVVLARYRFEAGQVDEALKELEKHVSGHANEVQPLAGYIDLLWRAGKRDEARVQFEKLRAISSEIDNAASSPVFARLAPIAAELGLPADWRVAATPATDLGERPPLDNLGPFRWQPSIAPDWTLIDAHGVPRSLKALQGKPVVVIFYLGYGCLHCAEQLRAFAPLAQQFADAGVELVAISSDGPEGLKMSLENYKEGAFPFPLVADPQLDVFRAYRAYDDFEEKPLHGTFLVDAAGQIRWQDISYEPFMDAKFVLQEAERQRQLDATP